MNRTRFKSDDRDDPRAVAAGIITEWLAEPDHFPERSLSRVKRNRAFVTELVYGVVRRLLTLEWIENQFMSHSPPRPVQAILHIGVYQLIFMDDVEEYAAVHESVGLAEEGWRGLINAVLRRVQRERTFVLRRLSRAELTARYSFPDELVRRWTRHYGETDTARLCEWHNEPPQTCVRPDPRRIDAPAFEARCREAGIELVPHPFRARDRCFVLPRGVAVPDVPGYREGLFTIQDPSTLTAVDLLDPQPGETVLDACAAPGGKLQVMAARMNGEGRLVAMEKHADRVDRLRENLERTRDGWVELRIADATEPPSPEEQETFDAILLDVPCTNTGVLRRRADARWRFSPARLKKLNRLQTALLDAALPRLRPGGRLVYSTCSLEEEENEKLLRGWVSGHPDAHFAKARKNFPPRSHSDGSYAALVRKIPREDS
ncbi:16S rRNA (cytosine(967)-C(5))-methyltransferase RsmB [Kiritimatiella glycovorans]|uniref:16S rRNA (cytosine(967)-C(5))-methyltransferase n=1 Tax=Kiritimatiella glycovorans TaxID=1307763 RepID=A0A0G3EKG2_9BACT|nr:16S rRNA (cytosine(967)-C(5))-methyltransferase RsmB [Kiritimatiella glycovorans]AKJ64664.1 Ribosomal RNA small subunit methyltransferase B [Kiritimatiella glycovorans]